MIYIVIELKTYPVQFTFQSNNTAYIEGQPFKVRDSSFNHILSSVPKESFWGKGMTNVVSLLNDKEIGITEIGLKPHKPLKVDKNPYSALWQVRHAKIKIKKLRIKL